MKNYLYPKRDVTQYYFTLPNQIFDLGLHHIEIDIYAYLLRIEDRRTYQCIVSYPTIARQLRLSVNTVAKYVAALEEHGLIRTERTEIVTKEGVKRNSCLRYTILPIQNAIDLYHERQLPELQRTAAIQKAQELAARKGVKFTPATELIKGGEQIGA